MAYLEITKKRCIALRRKFGEPKGMFRRKSGIEGFLSRHRLWVKFVNDSNLTDFEKKVCIKEFLNPRDIIRYERKK
jgi:hypothetical protein